MQIISYICDLTTYLINKEFGVLYAASENTIGPPHERY